jgi:cell division protein FtsL
MAEQSRRAARSKPKTRAELRAAAARTRKPRTPSKERRRPSMRLALFLVVLVGLLFAFVYPTRTFLDQRNETNKARAQLEVLQSENARLARESKRLSTDSEIERLAREKYGLVKPGERPFVILPAPSSTVPPPTSTVPIAP